MKSKFLALAALVLGLASCQKDTTGFDVVVDGEQETTISVSLPEATRAESDKSGLENVDLENTYDIRYILEIYDANKSLVKQRDVKCSDDTSTTFNVRLVPGYEYYFVVWADFVEQGTQSDIYYNTANGLKAVTVNNWVAMTEARDAYTGVCNVKKYSSASNIDIDLIRPFAKLRVITTDVEALTALNNLPTQVETKYSVPLYKGFNALDKTTINYDNVATLTYNPYIYGENDNKNLTLLVDYIFCDNTTDIVNFSMKTTYANGMTSTTNFNTDIPLVRNKVTTIKGSILTDGNDIKVDVGDDFVGENFEYIVESAAEAQAVLDNAAANTIIRLQPGVNYGTLYLRPINGGTQTKVIDWVGNNYGFETYSLFENLTIVGAEGASIDAIKIEGGTYYNSEHSQKDLYPVMLSLIELKNVVFRDVTFTGNGGYDPQGYGNAVNLSGNNIKVDGLTFENCVLNNSNNNARLLYKTESTTHVHNYTYGGETFTFIPSLKDITITESTFNGGYMGLELRETENVTITNNEFNVNDRNILLVVNTGCTYTGNVTITGNVSNNAKQRFVRADGTGDAVVVISGNTINNYQGADTDYIKVTNGNNVTIKNNIMSLGTQQAFNNAVAAAQNGDVIYVGNGTYDMPYFTGKELTFQGTDDAVIFNEPNANQAEKKYLDSKIHFINVIIDGTKYGNTPTSHGFVGSLIETYTNCTIKDYFSFASDNVTVNNTTFVGQDGQYFWTGLSNEIVFNSCTFNCVDRALNVCSHVAGESHIVTFNDCTFTATTLNKSVLEIDGSYGPYTINLNNCTATGFNVSTGTGESMFNIKKDPANVTIKIDGNTWISKDIVKDENGNMIVATSEALASVINNANSDVTVKFSADLEGNITLNQKAGKHFTIDGNGKNYNGGIHIFGNGGMNDRWMTIKNINFDGTGLNGDQGCIYTTGAANGVNSYACNVTIEDCTFTGAGVAAIRQNVGGERNWTIKRCTVASDMHSFLQVSNTNESLIVENCNVYSKNGANLNYTSKASFTGCEFDVKGYAVRVGVNGSNSTETKVFNFTDCTLKSANDDGDAVVIIRQDAQQATLNFVNTTLDGNPQISGNVDGKTTINGLQ